MYITSAISAGVNDSVILECIGSGNPRPSMSWMHNGLYLESQRMPINNTVNSFLKLPAIQYNDTGLYICIANNSGGEERAVTTINVKGEYFT